MERAARTDERQRQRQLSEIERLLEQGELDRAGGLLVEHLSAFPGDAEAAGRLLARHHPERRREPGQTGPIG